MGLAMTGSLFISHVATAADDDGATLYKNGQCSTCHGSDARTPTTPFYPKLAGQNELYLFQQMKAIRYGERTNGMSATMKTLTMAVTIEEFRQIAKWLASLNCCEPKKAEGEGN
jgi:cytochrome c